MKLLFYPLLFFYSSLLFSQIESYDHFNDFEKAYLTSPKKDTAIVINFWATWCAPCVKELPFFETLPSTVASKNIKTVLVSLDFKSQIEKRLLPFLKNKQIKSKVVLLTDGNANSWINKVDTDWSGAIPATLLLYKNKKTFYEKSYATQQELIKDITTLIYQP